MSLKDLIEQIIDNKMEARQPMSIGYYTLKSLSPLCFFPKGNPQIEIKESFLVVPKHRVFTGKDLGKDFVMASNDGGQTCFYLYEPSRPQGSNGIPYKFKGDIKCNLTGTCPDGPVTVTGGTIEVCTHKEAVD